MPPNRIDFTLESHLIMIALMIAAVKAKLSPLSRTTAKGFRTGAIHFTAEHSLVQKSRAIEPREVFAIKGL